MKSVIVSSESVETKYYDSVTNSEQKNNISGTFFVIYQLFSLVLQKMYRWEHCFETTMGNLNAENGGLPGVGGLWE